MRKRYKIIDILHTGHHGKEGESKVGEKYDRRRGRDFSIDLDEYNPGDTLILFPVVYTTPYEKSWSDDEFTYIKTLNSVYVVRELGTINTSEKE